MSDNENLPDDDRQSDRKSSGKWNRINFLSIILAVAFLLIGLLEVAVMEFFTLKFTVIFASIMGGLALLSAIVWFISNKKLH